MDERFWFLKQCPLFEQLTENEIRAVEADSRARQFARGNVVYMPEETGDAVFLVTAGRIKLYHITTDGKQAVLTFIDPGEIFGEITLLDGSAREEFAEAMEATTLIRIPRETVQQLMERHANVALGVTKLMGLRRRRVERRLKSLLFRSNRDRLVSLLMELADKYGQATSEGIELGIKLSHQDLANIIGSTRETVTVTLGELQSEGSLLIRRRRIILTKAGDLARSVNVPPPVGIAHP